MNDSTLQALPTVNATIYPRGALDVLSRDEVARLRDASSGGMHELLRRCALAVLTSGSPSDDPRAARELYPDFDIQVQQQDRGVRIDLVAAPASAFVDGDIIRGVAELLFAVVRDLAYTAIELNNGHGAARDLDTSDGITDGVFALLREDVPPLTDDRYLADDLRVATALVRSGRLAGAAGVDLMPTVDESAATP